MSHKPLSEFFKRKWTSVCTKKERQLENNIFRNKINASSLGLGLVKQGYFSVFSQEYSCRV